MNETRERLEQLGDFIYNQPELEDHQAILLEAYEMENGCIYIG